MTQIARRRLRGATALPLLRKALRDLDPKVRSRDASTLHWSGQAKATASTLIAAFKDPDRDVRDAAAWALGAIGAALGRSGTAGASLREALCDPDPRVRAAAVYVVPVLKSETGASIPLLIARLKDSNVLVRMAAAIGLGQFGPAAGAAVPALLNALADADEISIDDFTVSSKAAQSLWTISPEARASTIDHLFALLGSADDQVRNHACRTIGDLGAKLSPRLFQRLADPKISRAVRVEILGILAEQHGAAGTLPDPGSFDRVHGTRRWFGIRSRLRRVPHPRLGPSPTADNRPHRGRSPSRRRSPETEVAGFFEV